MKKNVQEIIVKIEKEEWSKCLDQAFKKKNKEIKIDGFRKGNAPKETFIKKFGIESLFMDAVDKAVEIAYKKVLDEKEIIPVIEPKLEVKKVDENAVEFCFTITTKPEISLGTYKGLKIKKSAIEVTEEQIEAEIEKIRNKYAEIVIKEKGKIAVGDTAVIDFKGLVDGKALEGGSGENFPLEIGSHTFIPGFEEELVGLKVDETKTLNLKFPEDYVADLKGKEVVFEVKINEIKTRKLPELNEEFYKDIDYDQIKTKEEFYHEIKLNLQKQKEAELEDEYVEKCLEAAANNMKIEINEEIIDEEIHRMIHQFEQKLAGQGLKLEQYYQFSGQTHEDLHKQMEEEATKRVKYRYLLEAVAEKEKVEYSDAEAEEKAQEMADNYGISKEELLKAYGSLDVIKYDMKMHKAMEIIKS